jgi:uncharacterized protein (DUF885 family)
MSALGHREVSRAGREIAAIRQATGMDSAAFYRHLADASFLLSDRTAVAAAFARTDSIIRQHLTAFTGPVYVAPVPAVEWPGADDRTPPARYLTGADNEYGRPVFQYNFRDGQFNSRAVEWLYLHEAIPGHHLQATLAGRYPSGGLQQLFRYPGNFEGWASYVEYYGADLGLYRDPYSLLGKWEWDLVRSARLVIDAGIHYHGWNRQHALGYWRKTIPGQDGIAMREIGRVTAWPAQVLSYKAGADCIMQLRRQTEARYGTRFDAARFHRAFLSFGNRPLEVIRRHFEAAYEKEDRR